MLKTTRRQLLRAGSLATLMAGLPGRVAFAQAATDRCFVLIVLRGGMDGLSTVVPHGDPDYRQVRGTLALTAPGAGGAMADLDGYFGLHPALADLVPWYRSGMLLPIQAVATPYRERSHFDAQDLLETGLGQVGASDDGWLNRALSLMGGQRRLGLALGQTTPLVLRGSAPIATWSPEVLPTADDAFLELVSALYADDPLLAGAFGQGLEARAMTEMAVGDLDSDGRGSAQAQQRALVEAAGRLLRSPDGPRVAVLETGGWDTHAGQGAEDGRLARALNGLNQTLTVLRDSLGSVWSTTVVLAVTEFGRTVAVNGTGGSDHGTGGVALLAGPGVSGGRVAGDWPGLAPSALHEGRDLRPTTDLRAVLKAVLTDHLGLPRGDVDRYVFPGSAHLGPSRGLFG